MEQATFNPPRVIGYIPLGNTCPLGNEHLGLVTLQSWPPAKVISAPGLPPDTPTEWCPCDPYAAGPREETV